MVRGTHNCGLWSIKAGGVCFFKYVFYEVGEGNCVWFWYDCCCGHLSLKDLTLICLCSLFLRMHGFVKFYFFFLQMGEIGAGIYSYIELFMTRSWKTFLLSSNFFILSCQGGKELIGCLGV